MTIVEYGRRFVSDPRFEVVTPAELRASSRTFDIAISISPCTHDGPGRYGDALDPDSDLRTVAYLRETVVMSGGTLILAMPSGVDHIDFNAHRIYGAARSPLITRGLRLADSKAFSEGIRAGPRFEREGGGGGWGCGYT